MYRFQQIIFLGSHFGIGIGHTSHVTITN